VLSRRITSRCAAMVSTSGGSQLSRLPRRYCRKGAAAFGRRSRPKRRWAYVTPLAASTVTFEALSCNRWILRPPRGWLGSFGYLRTTAAPLVAYAVGRLEENFTDELDHGRQAIDSGAAQTKLEEWIEATQSVG
jgi:hypothetical protein